MRDGFAGGASWARLCVMAKIVRAHDPEWRTAFAAEARTLRAVFGDAAIDVHHIGSTAVSGILAKPVIDILVEARSLAMMDARQDAMAAAGYEARGAYGIEGRLYFVRRTAGVGTGFHVHVYETGSAHVERHLRFRDYLIAHPEVAQAYSVLKASLADAEGVLRDDYADEKAPFVRKVEALALRDG